MADNQIARIESEMEVRAYLQNLKYALDHGAAVDFQMGRRVDDLRDRRFTNKFTIDNLFPNEKPEDALRRELKLLEVENYMQTVKDIRFPRRSEMREFGKVYNRTENVYIKIRVELLGRNGEHQCFVMSFHFAEKKFEETMFPYRKKV